MLHPSSRVAAEPLLPNIIMPQAEMGSQWNTQNPTQTNLGPRADGTPCTLLQGDHSGSSQPPVDMKTKVAFQDKPLIL